MDAKEIKNIVIVGAGLMGSGIAQVFATAGYDVTLFDVNENALELGMQRMDASLNALVESGKILHKDIPSILNRVKPSADLEAATKKAEFVLEAVPENIDIKKDVFRKLEAFCPKDAIIASNTSGLNIFDVIKLNHPARLVAAHWYLPPQIIPLVEIAPGPETDPEIAEVTAQLMERIGKRPIRMKKYVRSFIVNQIQNAISAATFKIMSQDVVDYKDIDLAVKCSLGIRLPVVGVVQTIDFTGLDTASDILNSLGTNVPQIEDKVKQGHLGAKTGKGFYDYGGRSENDIQKKRDALYLKVLDLLTEIHAFDPV